MGKTYRVAIIGLGVIGQRMLANMPDQGRLAIAGGWDVDGAACASARAAFPWLTVSESAEELITAPDTDLVYVGTPPSAHAGYVRMAMAAGKAVFCEKPLGVDLDESRALTEEIATSRVPAAINLSLAGAPGVEYMHTALGDGSLGDIVGADIRLHFAQWPRSWQDNARWLANRNQGGFMREVATHFLYLAEALLGPAKLHGSSVRYPADGESAETHALARLDCGGIPVSLAGSVGGVGPDLIEFTLWGTKQSLRLNDFYQLSRNTGGDWQNALPQRENLKRDAYMRQLDALVQTLDGDDTALPSFGEALAVQELVEAILLDA